MEGLGIGSTAKYLGTATTSSGPSLRTPQYERPRFLAIRTRDTGTHYQLGT